MKLRIESNGYSTGTNVFVGEERIEGITRIEWSIDAHGRAQCRLTVTSVDASIAAIEIELKEAQK